MAPLPPDLTALEHLDRARLKASEYFAPLLESSDELTKVGSWSVLLERQEIRVDQYPRVLELCSYGAVRTRAFRFFEDVFEHDLAAEAIGHDAPGESVAETLGMEAEIGNDHDTAAKAARQRYLANGRFDALLALTTAEEDVGGWRPALATALQMLSLFPHEPIAANRVMALLFGANQPDQLASVTARLERNNLHPYLCAIYRAGTQLQRGNARGALTDLARAASVRLTRPDVVERVRTVVARIAAEANEDLRDYPRAYAAYTDMNRISRDSKTINLDELPRVTREATELRIPPLPADPLTGAYVVMTGFPRSGTTLLENALNAHPGVETFEEIPTSATIKKYLGRTPMPEGAEAAVTYYLAARTRYYDEILRRKRKAGATVFIDKLPMRSLEAGFMVKLFPDKRYIFSIRHPFDVVLSCFKQDFGRNLAMEHFRTFEGAAKLYDLTMSEWFKVYTLDDPRVHYLRYDTLVTEFEPTVRNVLGFLGLDWDEAVRNFAEAADARSARTPSYQKVRQGLTIGVQTQWRNYGFLFQSPEAKPLYKWAEFFGYPTK